MRGGNLKTRFIVNNCDSLSIPNLIQTGTASPSSYTLMNRPLRLFYLRFCEPGTGEKGGRARFAPIMVRSMRLDFGLSLAHTGMHWGNSQRALILDI